MKSYLKILISGCIVISLFACGGSSGSGSSNNASASTNTATDLHTDVTQILNGSIDASFLVTDSFDSDSSSNLIKFATATISSQSLDCTFGGTVDYSGDSTETETELTTNLTLTFNDCAVTESNAVSGQLTFATALTKTSETSGEGQFTFNGNTSTDVCSLTFKNLVMQGTFVDDSAESLTLTGSLSADCGAQGSLTCDWTNGFSIDEPEMTDEQTAQLLADNCT